MKPRNLETLISDMKALQNQFRITDQADMLTIRHAVTQLDRFHSLRLTLRGLGLLGEMMAAELADLLDEAEAPKGEAVDETTAAA